MAAELPAPFGKYFLTEKLATGGMAEIYLAKLIGPGGFEKPLVIKQIHPRLTGQRHFVDLFVAEAKTLVALAHGNIVPVYDLGVVDDIYYIAMDYIDGPTLWRLTEALARREGQVDPALVAWIGARILEGLDYAHRKGEGVIHRDLSPRNVMLSRDGEVKLVDFGIAVTLGAPGEGEHSAPPTGSFPYMSPEQVRREPLTGQTDLFSVGVLMWEMLTGQRLFARDSADATLAAVTGAEIRRPSDVRPEVPAKLDEVVMRALDRDVTARWPTAGDMLAAINKYLYALDETPGPRDVAALVARYCPPETRRLPTNALPDVADDGTPPPPPSGPSGPRTAVIPRDGGGPRGKKQRAGTKQQSFATNIELKDMLDRATPMFGVQAIAGDTNVVVGEPEEDDKAGEGATHVTAPRAAEPEPDPEPPPDELAPRRSPLRRIDSRPPNQYMLVLAAIGAIALGLGAVYVFYRGRGAVLQPDAMPKHDAAWYSLDPDARGVTPIDAPEIEAIDAAVVVIDASLSPPDAAIDATPHATIDAPAVAKPDASVDAAIDAAAPIGTATLVIGANPWGNITVDGVAKGVTPKEVSVPTGHHVVIVTYTGEEPAKSKTFPVDVVAGERKEILAEF